MFECIFKRNKKLIFRSQPHQTLESDRKLEPERNILAELEHQSEQKILQFEALLNMLLWKFSGIPVSKKRKIRGRSIKMVLILRKISFRNEILLIMFFKNK